MTVISTPAHGEDCTPLAAQLTLCNNYVKALEVHEKGLKDQIALLKTTNGKLVDELKKAETPALMPTWAWFVTGIVAGGVLVYTINKR